MRILLPPSEAKNPGGRGRCLDAASRPAQPIDEPRQLALDSLAQLLHSPDAAGALLLPGSVVQAAIEMNRQVRSSPTMPAVQRYSGVVYDGLDIRVRSAAVRALAGRQLLIFSGLFGILRGAEPIPAYRVPAKAVLPNLGVVGTFWRPRLTELMPGLLERAGLIVDLRSTDYAAMWLPAPADAEAARLVSVRVLSRKPGGGEAVISYPSKLAKGKLTGALLERHAARLSVRSAEDVAAAWSGLGGRDARLCPRRVGTGLDLVE